MERRLKQHNSGDGALHTRKRLPVKLVCFEEYSRIDWAFNREKQVQGWNWKQKEAHIAGNFCDLPVLAQCTNSTHHKNYENKKGAVR